MDKEYIREAVQGVLPLLQECATAALERGAAIDGNIAVEFTVEGEPDVGGVVGTSQVIEDQTDIADAALRECVQETMYAIEIDPPTSGGVVTVRYPFAFSDDGEP